MRFICAHCAKMCNYPLPIFIDDDPFKTGGSKDSKPYCDDCVAELAARAEKELEGQNERSNQG